MLTFQTVTRPSIERYVPVTRPLHVQVINFQRRTRLWLAHNELFLDLYEEHRTYLMMKRTAPLMSAFEDTIQVRPNLDSS